MVYECDGQTFRTEKEFKRHIRSRSWHRLNASDVIKLKTKSDILYNVVRNPQLLFGVTNLITPLGNKGILILPFSKDKVGSVLKRSIAGRLEGPTFELGGIRYKFESPNLIYDFEFHIKRINEEFSEVSVLSSMSVNIGIAGRLLPGEVMKALQKMVTPRVAIDNINRGFNLLLS